jgi:hypothetical protein
VFHVNPRYYYISLIFGGISISGLKNTRKKVWLVVYHVGRHWTRKSSKHAPLLDFLDFVEVVGVELALYIQLYQEFNNRQKSYTPKNTPIFSTLDYSRSGRVLRSPKIRLFAIWSG